jgi:hypothetical protein
MNFIKLLYKQWTYAIHCIIRISISIEKVTYMNALKVKFKKPSILYKGFIETCTNPLVHKSIIQVRHLLLYWFQTCAYINLSY